MSGLRALLLVTPLLALMACGGPQHEPDGDINDTSAQAPAVADASEPVIGITPLPDTVELEVHVEGEREWREASRFESPQGYSIYVLPQVVMTEEEPGNDQAFARVDGRLFMRIQRLDPATDPRVLREQGERMLEPAGPAADIAGQEGVWDEGIGTARLLLHAGNDEVSLWMFVFERESGLFRVLMHLPRVEAVEGIAPSFHAMLGSIRVTGPLPER